MATVSVVSIFTRGARSSETAELRRARVASDIARANEAWSTGFPPGVSCNINFVSFREFFRPDVTLLGSTVPNIGDPRVENLISQTKAETNNAVAIYVVYVSGLYLGSGAIGNAGPIFDSFVSQANYQISGHCVMSDDATDTYALAHEAGHVLFGRFPNPNNNNFIIDDPSNPGQGHSDNPQNLMYPFIPSSMPFINALQCGTASQSRVILENVAGANALMGFSNAMAGGNALAAAGFGANQGFGLAGNNPMMGMAGPSSDCSCCGPVPPHHGHGSYYCVPIPKEVKRLNKRVLKQVINEEHPDVVNTKFQYVCKNKRIVIKR
jgi:hypothetical protein